MTDCTSCNYYDTDERRCLAKLAPKDGECDYYEEFESQMEMFECS
jgi:hypothetical protein